MPIIRFSPVSNFGDQSLPTIVILIIFVQCAEIQYHGFRIVNIQDKATT